MACVTTFFLSDEGSCIFIPLATITLPKKITIINPIDAHLLSSPSMPSKRKVAAVPAIMAKAIRIQNKLFNFLSFSLFSATLTGGSPEELSETGSELSISGVGVETSTESFLESLGPIVGSDVFFLNFAKVNF